MSEKCDPLGNAVEIDFIVDFGHLGPNKHFSEGSKRNFHRNPFFIGVKVRNLYETYDFTKIHLNRPLHA